MSSILSLTGMPYSVCRTRPAPQTLLELPRQFLLWRPASWLRPHTSDCQVASSWKGLGCVANACTREALSDKPVHITVSRRLLWTSTFLALPLLNADVAAAEQGGSELVSYRDSANGFALLYPEGWKMIDKPGAAALFQDPTNSSNSIGMTVNPVKVSSLKELGPIDDIVAKLLASERKKSSTLGVEVKTATVRESGVGVPAYAIDYILDSTRGLKEVLLVATIANSRLFILQISFTVGSPVEVQAALRDAWQSFGLL